MRNEENISHSHNFMTMESNPAKQWVIIDVKSLEHGEIFLKTIVHIGKHLSILATIWLLNAKC